MLSLARSRDWISTSVYIRTTRSLLSPSCSFRQRRSTNIFPPACFSLSLYAATSTVSPRRRLSLQLYSLPPVHVLPTIRSKDSTRRRHVDDDNVGFRRRRLFSSKARTGPLLEQERAKQAAANDGAIIVSGEQQQQQQHATPRLTLTSTKAVFQSLNHQHLHSSQRRQHNDFLTVRHVLNDYMKRGEHLQPHQVAIVWSNLQKAAVQQQQESSRNSNSSNNSNSNKNKWNDKANNNNNNTLLWTNDESSSHLQTLLAHSMQLVNAWNGRSTATVTHSLAKLLNLTTNGSGDGTPAAAVQQQQLESLWNALFIRSTTLLESSSLSSRDNFKAVEVSNLWWAYAKVSSPQRMVPLSPPPERLLKALESAADGCMEEFGPQGLSNVAWAIATLNCNHHPAVTAAAAAPPPPSPSSLLNAIAQMAQVHVNHFKPQELSNLVWAFATLNHNAPSLLDAVASRVIHTRILDDFTPQALANTAWAFATFHHHHHYKSSPSLFNALAMAAQARIGQFKAQELSNTAWAFATVQHKQQRAPSALLFHAIARAAVVRMDQFNPQALSNTAWAFATLKYNNNNEHLLLLNAIATRVRLQIQHFSPQALSNTAWAFAKLNHADPALFHALAGAARVRLREFNPQELANTTWAFATFNYQVPSVLLRDIATSKLFSWSFFTAQGMSNMAWALAVFNSNAEINNNNNSVFMTDPDSSFAQTLLSMNNNDNSENSLAVEYLCQLYQFHLWCKEQNVVAADWFPKDLSRRCKEAFVSIEVAEPSVLQNDIVTTLATLPDVSHVEVEVLTEIGYRLDAVVTFRGGGGGGDDLLMIGVEVDGPSHFVGQSQSPNGKTVLKRRQLRALEGWKLVSVPYWEWNKILQFSGAGHANNMKLEKQRYLQDLLRQAV